MPSFADYIREQEIEDRERRMVENERARGVDTYQQQYEAMQRMRQEMLNNLTRVPRVYTQLLPSEYEPVPTATRERPPAKEPTTTTIDPGEAIDAEYAALVADLGLSSVAMDLARFKDWLHTSGLQVYQREEVQEYLHTKYKVPVGNITSKVLWGWRPLRQADQIITRAVVYINGEVQRGAPPYAKPIPMPVLLTVKAVRDLVPSAHFFVSDELQAERIPDPFLLVEIGSESFVIERWDEPTFRAT
jgi:hypothetical protein